MNRNLWGVENFEEITIRHSKFAAQRFAHEAAPTLTSFANSSPALFVAGVKAARQRIVARTDEDRETFLRKGGFSKSEASKIIETVLGEENRKPESIFDFVQGITAFARGRLTKIRVLNWKEKQSADCRSRRWWFALPRRRSIASWTSSILVFKQADVSCAVESVGCMRIRSSSCPGMTTRSGEQ